MMNATRRQVLTDVAAIIRDYYADREVGDTLAATLSRHPAQGCAPCTTRTDSV